jgi:hypothetical protein
MMFEDCEKASELLAPDMSEYRAAAHEIAVQTCHSLRHCYEVLVIYGLEMGRQILLEDKERRGE